MLLSAFRTACHRKPTRADGLIGKLEPVLSKRTLASLPQVYVDTVGDAERHRERLAQRFPGVEFTVCPKADAIYPIVSAASIVAKTARDEQLRDFRVPEAVPVQRDFGSGYPGGAMLAEWQRAGQGGMLKDQTMQI